MAQFFVWINQKSIWPLLTSFGLFLLLSYWSQTISAQTTLDFQNFTQKDGLASDYLLTFYQDHQGFIWIGTENGMNRFDGHHFLHFKHDPADPQTLDDNWVQRFYEDNQHNLWINTEKGLNRLDRKTGQVERVNMYKSGQKIQGKLNNIWEDAEANLWVLIGEEDFFQLKQSSEEGDKWFGEYADSLSGINKLWSEHTIIFVTSEELWLADSMGIKHVHIPSQKTTFFNFFPSDTLRKNKVDIIKSVYLKDGTVVVYAQSNLFILNTKANAPKIKAFPSIAIQSIDDRLESANINFIKEQENVLLIYVNRELFFLNTQTGQLESIKLKGQTSNKPFPNFLRALFKDQQGNYWIGTEGSGFYLSRKVESPFTFYQNDPADPNSVSGGQIRSFAEDGRGGLWVSILNHGLDHFTYKNNKQLQKERAITPIANQSNVLPSDRMVKIIQGPEKTLWMASLAHGIIKMDSTGRQFTVFDQGPKDPNAIVGPNRIWGLTMDLEGYIWAGTWEDGLLRIDPQSELTENFRHDPDNPNSLISDGIRYLYTSPQGILWIGTNAGLSRFDSKLNQFTNFRHDPDDPRSLSDNLVWAIHEDRQEQLWVGTNTGLNRYDQSTGRFDHFYEKNGLPNNTIYGLLEDDVGTLWVSTENGLARQLATDSDLTFFPLGLNDGLQTTSFIPKAFLNSSKSEQLFFGSTQGILAVKPSLLQLGAPQPQLVLHALSTFNPYIEKGESFTDYFINNTKDVFKLGYQDQSITVMLSDLNWKGNRGLRYDYQLVGFNRQWMPLGGDMQITFTNLPPGSYQLLARARNAENITSEVSELIRLRVYPPWWNSWWAYIAYALVGVATILTVYRFQLGRQLEKKEAQNLKSLDAFKTRLYTNITHEFRTPLTIISGMLDQIEKNPKSWLKKGTQMIRKNNTNLLDLINQMLELQKVESGNLKLNWQLGDIIPLMKTIFDQFQAYAQSKEQQMEFISWQDSLFMDFDSEKILRIVSNLLSNAIKFTPEKGKITFIVFTDNKSELQPNNCLVLAVKDTGPGIPEEQIPRIFDRFYQTDVNYGGTGTGIGLSLTHELVTLLNGKIEVSSEEGQGSTFQVFLPITQKAEARKTADLSSIPSAVFGLTGQLEKKQASQAELPIALIVEDNKDIAAYLQLCLEGDYQLEFAANGQEGIDRAFEHIPDIIISDVMMPKKDGFELCETLKQDQSSSHIPIILLTAKSDVNSRIQGLKYGADDYLAKPFNEEELLVRMKNLLDIRRKLQARYQDLYGKPIPIAAKAKVPAPALEDEFILKLKEVFEERMDDPAFDLNELSKALFLSRSQLGRKVKALTGKSLSNFLKSLRLQKARQLLLTTDYSITKVALEVGMSNISYFSRSYSEEFGESPSSTAS